ncbi:hypothetical protein A7P89_01025 [Eikenella corrodens]|uniref:Uncharacterized protein n=1 Tax=Eikenella corrodens TaxID=539 RepID=A0A1A9RUG3_EIKCO|nr:hypothetical protein A7P89_01025 [Eikenella corrodens]
MPMQSRESQTAHSLQHKTVAAAKIPLRPKHSVLMQQTVWQPPRYAEHQHDNYCNSSLVEFIKQAR